MDAKPIKFSVRCKTKFGESVAILGSDECVGAWNKKSYVAMSTDANTFPVWSCEIQVPLNTEIEYKYIIVRADKIKKWELDGRKANRTFNLKPDEEGVTATEQDDGEFDVLPGVTDVVNNGKTDTRPNLFSAQNVDGEFLKNLVQESNVSCSWRKRLSYVRRLLTDDGFAQSQNFNASSTEHLAIIVVYLTFVSSGQIRCEEDGSHYRPNHHANEARQIEEALTKISNESNQYLIRKIYPQMPSYRSDFTATVPLTRIRDIAHRGDIPHELKQEIKHTLQNKLHRSAGPEDLVNTERMLERITAPGANYSWGFVEQFQIFTRELREFFNATGLDELLNEIRSKNEPREQSAPLIDRFLQLKHDRVDAIEQLEGLVALRRELSDAMKSMDGGEVLQRVRLADIELEKFSFVLLAGINNLHLEWPIALRASRLALESIALSGTAEEEARAVLADLREVNQEDMLRLKASMERSNRICDDFSRNSTTLFEGVVQHVGSAFGVDQHAVNVFVEAEIRSNIMFQFSRLVSWAMRTIRSTLNLPPWDVLFPGEANGKILFAHSIEQISESDLQEPRIVILETAEGDEDVPAAIKGVVLGHDLPHLSHLGVRARQAKVVFVNAEEQSAFDELKKSTHSLNQDEAKLEVKLTGSIVSLEASTSPLDSTADSQGGKTAPTKIKISEPEKLEALVVNPAEASTASSGTKANSAGTLYDCAESNGDFKTPQGMVLPFSTFQAATKSGKAQEYTKMINNFDSLSLNDKETKAEEISKFILEEFPVADEIIEGIQKAFPGDAILMVRSSANCEDLEDMSGAGLYDSFANVPAADATALSLHIRRVWASLWTKRAALSRSQYKIPHEKALMAVLVQEMLNADISFIMFSHNPINGNADEVYMEMAVGMGETLASAGERGSPYRMTYDVTQNKAQSTSLASFSHALVPGKSDLGLTKQTIDYSKQRITTDPSYREEMAEKIAGIGRFLEESFQKPQDIEGVLVKDQIYLVQSRPMIL